LHAQTEALTQMKRVRPRLSRQEVANSVELRGKRVLLIDWDLEAPGLHRYFPDTATFPSGEGPKGVIEFFADLEWAFERDKSVYSAITDVDGVRRLAEISAFETYLIRDVYKSAASVDLMRAGRLGPGFANTVGRFAWAEFFGQYGLLFRTLRDLIAARYSYCIIDSGAATLERRPSRRKFNRLRTFDRSLASS
jgi:hypothetical protein